jgi:hypothetical protein
MKCTCFAATVNGLLFVVNAFHSHYLGAKDFGAAQSSMDIISAILKTITVIFVTNLKGTLTILYFINESVKNALDLKQVIDYITINMDYCSIF